MEIEENKLEEERSGNRALYVKHSLMDRYAVTYLLKAPKCQGGTSFIRLMTWLVVAQKLRNHDTSGCNWLYLEMVHRLFKMTVWILGNMIAQLMTVSMSPRWASTERQHFWCDHFGNQRVGESNWSKGELLADFRRKKASDMLVAPS